MLASDTMLQSRYRIVRLIGQGGMGAVYEAVDERLGNPVALKQTLFGEAQVGHALEREARLLAGLRHPALPKVIDHFADSNGQFLVMEYIPGDDLATLLEQRGRPFAVGQVLDWADQILRALEYLHRQQPPVLHRDIKPQNLKLTAENEIVLLDFGLARGAVGSATQAGVSVHGYTPHYAPLEQIHNSGTEPRSDLYALGATLHHLLTGSKPPDALSRATSLLRRQNDPLLSPAELNPRVPPDVGALLMETLALNPEDRPASAALLRALLAEQRASLPATAGDEDEPAAAPAPLAATRETARTPSTPPSRPRSEPQRPASQPASRPPTLPPAAAPAGLTILQRILRELEALVAEARALRPRWLLPTIGLSAALITLLVAMTIGRGAPGQPAADGTPTTLERTAAAVEPTAAPVPTTPTRPAAPTPTERGEIAATFAPVSIESILPIDIYTGTLPLTLTLRGTGLAPERRYSLVADGQEPVVLEALAATPEGIQLRLSRVEPLAGAASFTLHVDDVRQPGATVTLRDYLERRLVRGVRADYGYTTRVATDEAGAYTTLYTAPDPGSDRLGVLRNGDEVELLADQTQGWYRVRVRPALSAVQPGTVGWIERWLVDDEGVPPTPQPAATSFAGLLLSRPRDAAVQCGTQFESSIYGSVEDAQGRGLAGATLTVTSADGRNRYNARTGRGGTYTVAGLGCTTWIVRLTSVPGVTQLQAGAVRVSHLNGGRYTAAEVRFRQQP